MQKPSNDAVNSTCSANAPYHEGTTARDRAEDDLAACLQVEIHRLRLLDAMPNHADVIVSVYLHGGISRRSCLVGESRTELEFEFGHVTKIMEIPRPYLSQTGSESVGVLLRSKRMFMGLGRRRIWGSSSNTNNASDASNGAKGSAARTNFGTQNEDTSRASVRQRGPLEFTVWLDNGKDRVCAGKCTYTLSQLDPVLACESVWLPILTEQGLLHSGLQVSLDLVRDEKHLKPIDQQDLEQYMNLLPANEPVGMVEEDEDIVDEGISETSADGEDDGVGGVGVGDGVDDGVSMASPMSPPFSGMHALGLNNRDGDESWPIPTEDGGALIRRRPPVQRPRLEPKVSTASPIVDFVNLSDSDTLSVETGENRRVSWRPRARRLGLAKLRPRSYSASQSGIAQESDAKRVARLTPHDYAFWGNPGHGVQGIVMMEIKGARDLPRWQNLTHTSFDMDPFVVVSFNRKVFRTRVCRHTLNPDWREKLYFHVHSREMSYSVRCAVYDWDNISSNDYVGEISLDISSLMNAAKHSTANDTLSQDEGDENDASHMVTFDLPLQREGHDEDAKFGKGKARPRLQLDAVYRPYAVLRRRFWREMLRLYDTNDTGGIDIDELQTMLLSLGSTLTTETLLGFFKRFGKQPFGDELTMDEGVRVLEDELHKPWTERRACTLPPDMEAEETDDTPDVERVIRLRACPLCHMPRLSHADERDIVAHLALCSSQEGRAVDDIMVSNFVTATQARRKWYTNMFRTVSQGVYRIGANSANILVQDRISGQLVEEKMQVYVRLGIRLLYQGAKSRMEGARARRMLRNMSLKQGAKYDHPSSVRAIKPFVMFHGIDENEMVDSVTSFATFNDFFCRRIRMELRPLAEPGNPGCMVSCADCRLMVFNRIDRATQLWIKGRQFSVDKLLGGKVSQKTWPDTTSLALAIFRLAPQDYHRFHAPVDGVVGEMTRISGEYYTVNPMAIRSAIDVYGENTRVVIPISTRDFGDVYLVAIGAMMVGSIILTISPQQHVKRGDELGYFKFGGSTLVLLVDGARIRWDDDLLINSNTCIETLVRVGMRIGVTPPATSVALSRPTEM